MKRLRRQFAVFTLVLVVGFVLIVLRFVQQLGREERSLARGYAEQVFDQVQQQQRWLLEAEEGRPFGEFRYFYSVSGLSGVSLARSPLSRLPGDDSRGLVGYFQIDPDGAVTTPYLPVGQQPSPGIPTGERQTREELQALLARLTSSFQARMREGATPPGKLHPPEVFELGASSKDVTVADLEPLSEKRSGGPLGRKRAENRILSQGEKSTEAELRVFEKQRPSSEEVTPPVSRAWQRARARQVSIDPFQARLVEKHFIVFYRKLWLDRSLYLQGFVLDGPKFFEWLMDQTFPRSPLAGFAIASLNLGDEELARYGSAAAASAANRPFFERSLGYPLNLFVWRIRAASYPRLAGRDMLMMLVVLAGAVLALGLVSIYRTAAGEVRLSQKRRDLVSAVTHELRTPLTSIRMYAEMLEEGMAVDDAKRYEYYGQISRESARLSRLIENVLQLARLEKRTYRVESQVRVPSLDFEDICRELSALAERQGFRLTCNVPTDPPPAIAYDPDAVRQVFLVFLDNSLKFAAGAAERTLEMSLMKEGDSVVWTWSDRGPGVPKGELGRIFDTFYRVEGETTRRTKGTGIGLAIARMLAEAMGARIEARNRPAADGGGLEIRLAFGATGKGSV